MGSKRNDLVLKIVKVKCMGLYQLSSAYMVWLLAWCFCEVPNSGSGGFFDSFASWGPLFLLSGCLSQSW